MKTNEEIARILHDALHPVPGENCKDPVIGPIGNLAAVARELARNSNLPKEMREQFAVLARETCFCYNEVKELVAAAERLYCAQQVLLSFSKK